MADRQQYQRDYRTRRKAEGYKRKLNPEEKAAAVKQATAWNANNRTRRAELRRQRVYGVTPEQYRKDYEAQHGLCALLCGRPIQATDHDHVTGIYRGLLCSLCNAAIGMLCDNPELLRRAAIYLEEKSHGLSNR
jgi:hypothetical protein